MKRKRKKGGEKKGPITRSTARGCNFAGANYRAEWRKSVGGWKGEPRQRASWLGSLRPVLHPANRRIQIVGRFEPNHSNFSNSRIVLRGGAHRSPLGVDKRGSACFRADNAPAGVVSNDETVGERILPRPLGALASLNSRPCINYLVTRRIPRPCNLCNLFRSVSRSLPTRGSRYFPPIFLLSFLARGRNLHASGTNSSLPGEPMVFTNDTLLSYSLLHACLVSRVKVKMSSDLAPVNTLSVSKVWCNICKNRETNIAQR